MDKLEKAAHFVQELDHLQHQHHRSSPLFDAPENLHDPPDENLVSVHESDNTNNNNNNNNNYNEQSDDSLEYHKNQPGDFYEEPLDGDDRRRNKATDDEAEQHASNRDHSDWLALDKATIKTFCHANRGADRIEYLRKVFLSHCSRYNMENLSSNIVYELIIHKETPVCEETLEEFLQLDETIAQFDRLFTKLLMRYNCHNGYSVKWNCDDCETAYKDWLCATHLPLYMKSERIKPCISFCERVEQRCPYLHPITREQYGGQPVFICRDPNIPFVPEITPDIPYSDPGKCYDLCHLSDNLTELVIDSLSKYDSNNCPKEDVIAVNVHNSCRDVNCAPTSSATEPVANGTNSDEGQTASRRLPPPPPPPAQPHMKKLEELREVLANYKNQAKTHRYHAEHSSIEQPRLPSGGDTGHSSR